MATLDTCREVVRQLWPYLDGALPDDLQEAVTTHLTSCSACRSHYDFERAFLDAVRETTPPGESFEPLRERVVAALVARGMAV